MLQLLREADYTALARRVLTYRAGYSAPERRRIEAEVAAGRAAGLVATNSLELGVHIGDLDCVVLLGYPVRCSSRAPRI